MTIKSPIDDPNAIQVFINDHKRGFGYNPLPAQIRHIPGLSPEVRDFYGYLRERAAESGMFFEHPKTFEALYGRSISTFFRNMKVLTEFGLVVSAPDPDRGPQKVTYRLPSLSSIFSDDLLRIRHVRGPEVWVDLCLNRTDLFVKHETDVHEKLDLIMAWPLWTQTKLVVSLKRFRPLSKITNIKDIKDLCIATTRKYGSGPLANMRQVPLANMRHVRETEPLGRETELRRETELVSSSPRLHLVRDFVPLDALSGDSVSLGSSPLDVMQGDSVSLEQVPKVSEVSQEDRLSSLLCFRRCPDESLSEAQEEELVSKVRQAEQALPESPSSTPPLPPLGAPDEKPSPAAKAGSTIKKQKKEKKMDANQRDLISSTLGKKQAKEREQKAAAKERRAPRKPTISGALGAAVSVHEALFEATRGKAWQVAPSPQIKDLKLWEAFIAYVGGEVQLAKDIVVWAAANWKQLQDANPRLEGRYPDAWLFGGSNWMGTLITAAREALMEQEAAKFAAAKPKPAPTNFVVPDFMSRKPEPPRVRKDAEGYIVGIPSDHPNPVEAETSAGWHWHFRERGSSSGFPVAYDMSLEELEIWIGFERFMKQHKYDGNHFLVWITRQWKQEVHAGFKELDAMNKHPRVEHFSGESLLKLIEIWKEKGPK